MVASVLLVLGGLVCLTAGAEGLVRGASSLARRMELSPLLIGLTVMAYGTSAPEGVVSIQAVLEGAPDLALGNVVGSNIGNVGLILGIAALLCPIRGDAQAVQLDIPIMIGVSALLLGLLADGMIGRLNGVVLLLGAISYTVIRMWGSWEESRPTVRQAFEEAVPDRYGWGWEGLFVVVGLALLVLGARLLVSGAVATAEAIGLSTAAIGLTIVAVGTSLPELATSVMAALRGHANLAIGNVVGSNIVNVLGVLGVTACVQPIDAAGVTWVDGGVLFGMAVLTVPFLWMGRPFSRWAGGALLVAYVAYVSFLMRGIL